MSLAGPGFCLNWSDREDGDLFGERDFDGGVDLAAGPGAGRQPAFLLGGAWLAPLLSAGSSRGCPALPRRSPTRLKKPP